MGPILTEEDLAHEQITDEDRRFLRKIDEVLRRGDEELEFSPLTPEMCDEAIKATQEGCEILEKLEGDIEAYEESLVEKGHHPVNKESIRGDAP